VPNCWEVADVIERKVSLAGLAGMLLLATHAAWGKLPTPTEAEVQAKKAAAEKKVKDEEAAKQALAKSQNRVAERYKKSRKRK
jgi:predicted outer membrane protein